MVNKDFAGRGRARGAAAGLIAAAALLALLLSFLLCGCGEEEQTTVIASGEEPFAPSISGLSRDQSRVVEEYGYPDHFFISIDPLSRDRIETWTYFEEKLAIDFDNGRRFGEEEIEDESAQYPPTALKPQDFDSTTTPESAAAFLGEPLFEQKAEGSLMYENTIVVYEKAVLLYRDDLLIGVDTKVLPPHLPVSLP